MVLSVQKSCIKDSFFNTVCSNIRKSKVIYDISMHKYETLKKNLWNFFLIFVVYDINIIKQIDQRMIYKFHLSNKKLKSKMFLPKPGPASLLDLLVSVIKREEREKLK